MDTISTHTPKTVLVVENELDLQEIIETVLGELDVSVACASDGQQALAYLDEHDVPVLILLDFHMPNMDGFEFRGHQLKDARLRDVPVLFMTALDQIPPQRDEVRGVHCIKKPFDRVEFLAAVREYVT